MAHHVKVGEFLYRLSKEGIDLRGVVVISHTDTRRDIFNTFRSKLSGRPMISYYRSHRGGRRERFSSTVEDFCRQDVVLSISLGGRGKVLDRGAPFTISTLSN